MSTRAGCREHAPQERSISTEREMCPVTCYCDLLRQRVAGLARHDHRNALEGVGDHRLVRSEVGDPAQMVDTATGQGERRPARTASDGLGTLKLRLGQAAKFGERVERSAVGQLPEERPGHRIARRRHGVHAALLRLSIRFFNGHQQLGAHLDKHGLASCRGQQ